MPHLIPSKLSSSVLTGLLATFMIFLHSCKKDDIAIPDPPPPVVGDRTFEIQFNQNTIALEEVDSVVVIFKKTNSNISSLQRFRKLNGKLVTTLESFPTAEFNAEVFLYTKGPHLNKSFQFTRSMRFMISNMIKTVSTIAPGISGSNSWEKHVVMFAEDIRIIIPLDHTNPYFELRTQNPRWDAFSVEKAAFNRTGNINAQVSSQLYECKDCFFLNRNISNKEAFVPFASGLLNKSWNNGEVTVRITDVEQKTTWEFYHAWNR